MLNTTRILERLPEWLQRRAHRVASGQGALGRLADVVRVRLSGDKAPPLPRQRDAAIRLVIGPANSAEQGFQWARAVERFFPGAAAVAMHGNRANVFQNAADLRVPALIHERSASWHAAFEAYLLRQTHIIWESGRPLLGARHGADVNREISALGSQGVRGALLFHGSDIRPPSRHADQSQWSPFRNPTALGRALEDTASRNAALALEAGVPVFVSTPDLLQWLPTATWCPVVVDSDRWRKGASTTKSGGPPVVTHAPSHQWLKGTDRIEPVLRRLAEEGVIQYRQIIGVPHSSMPDFYADADIVLDQFVLGIYGVAACEAMASGRLVMSHVDEFTRSQVRERTGFELPVYEATVDTLEDDLRRAVSEPEAFDDLRTAGPAFVDEVHDGRRSAAALASFLAFDT